MSAVVLCPDCVHFQSRETKNGGGGGSCPCVGRRKRQRMLERQVLGTCKSWKLTTEGESFRGVAVGSGGKEPLPLRGSKGRSRSSPEHGHSTGSRAQTETGERVAVEPSVSALEEAIEEEKARTRSLEEAQERRQHELRLDAELRVAQRAERERQEVLRKRVLLEQKEREEQLQRWQEKEAARLEKREVARRESLAWVEPEKSKTSSAWKGAPVQLMVRSVSGTVKTLVAAAAEGGTSTPPETAGPGWGHHKVVLRNRIPPVAVASVHWGDQSHDPETPVQEQGKPTVFYRSPSGSQLLQHQVDPQEAEELTSVGTSRHITSHPPPQESEEEEDADDYNFNNSLPSSPGSAN